MAWERLCTIFEQLLIIKICTISMLVCLSTFCVSVCLYLCAGVCHIDGYPAQLLMLNLNMYLRNVNAIFLDDQYVALMLLQV